MRQEVRVSKSPCVIRSLAGQYPIISGASSLPAIINNNKNLEIVDPQSSPPIDGVEDQEFPPATFQKHVYVVDDESSVRQAIIFSLRTAGYDVRPFANGRDFLEATSSLAPGCVVLDLRMPELGGLEVLDKLGEKLRLYPCIAITGYGAVATAVEAMKRGATDFFEKPFTDAVLLQALEAVFTTLRAHVETDIEHCRAVDLVASLSPRELETLQGLIAGLSNKVVAFQLGISVRTVEMHRGNLLDRLGAKSLADATRIALAAGVEPL